ncbi:hypothetical protein HAX54_035647 [Datura stramonium]|uniref:Uncharacterized protein n=1 Tax=Datura stramonium TaxID=4076 RepID=A0ABS8SFH1_DATST|nr:hypothetical protein [Datura stramonium]
MARNRGRSGGLPEMRRREEGMLPVWCCSGERKKEERERYGEGKKEVVGGTEIRRRKSEKRKTAGSGGRNGDCFVSISPENKCYGEIMVVAMELRRHYGGRRFLGVRRLGRGENDEGKRRR